MKPQRVNKPPVVLLLVVVVSFAVPQHVRAYAYYDLPLRTATIALPGQYHNWYGGEPGEPYELWIDPPTLRVGYDEANTTWYESFVVADVGDLPAIGAGLHLSTVMATPQGKFFIQGGGLDHPVPEAMDFAWRVGGGVIAVEIYYFGWEPFWVTSGGGRYLGWDLYTDRGYGEFAGVGGPNSPYAEIVAVPEPSTAVALLAAVCALAALAITGHRGHRRTAMLGILLCVFLGGASLGDEWLNADSEPGMREATAGPPFPSTRQLPAGYTYLPTFPRLLWSFGCGPTSAAMVCGYLDNSGFPDIWTDSNYPVFPTRRAPSDNYIFLRRDGEGNLLDDVEMYPSRCALSASEMGVFGLTYRGHVDDYWQYAPFTNLAQAYAASQLTGLYDGYCKDSSGNLQWTSHENIEGRGPDCLADYMGASAKYYRNCADGLSQYIMAVTGPPAIPFGTAITWQPYAWPHPNVSGAQALDANYGLTRYIVEHAGYHSKTTEHDLRAR